jgi:hypothetical protein
MGEIVVDEAGVRAAVGEIVGAGDAAGDLVAAGGIADVAGRAEEGTRASLPPRIYTSKNKGHGESRGFLIGETC